MKSCMLSLLLFITLGTLVSADTKLYSDQGMISTPKYNYYFHPKNHLLLEKLYSLGQQQKLVVREGKLLMRLNIKNFFNMNITENDIQSKVLFVEKDSGGNSITEKINFFYKFLFFKINIQMNAVIVFFEDRATITMTAIAPARADRFVKGGSGIFYHWQKQEGIEFLSEQFPHYDEALVARTIGSENNDLQKVGLKFCKDTSCVYTITSKISEQQVDLQFKVPRTIVERGFFPMLIQNSNKMGIYFEISGLDEGSFTFESIITIR
ncbi:MAG: hypothetical protein HQK50_12015 [Oligoflexia bacterium]|nr:hypothetical protein [Oligoflexia bacterium]MBF0366290.1 hypothetical protein [Oligoflexia bacterium]